MRWSVLALSLSLFPAAAEDDGLRWLSNYKEALAEARQTNKPIFLEYRCEP